MQPYSDQASLNSTRQITMLQEIQRQDDRWLTFVARTNEVFAAFPDLIPLRQTIFRGYIERTPATSSLAPLRHLAKFVVQRQTSSGDQTPVDIVFWLDTLREVQVEALVPVMKWLQAHAVRLSLITQPNINTNFALESINIIQFHAPYNWHIASSWKSAWAALCAVMPNDINIADFSAFLNDIHANINIICEVKRLLRQLKPKLFVSASDHLLPASAAISAAQQVAVRSLLLLHGAISPHHFPLTADRMAVWGNVSYDQMVSFGTSEQQLTILGSPRHDHFPSLPAAEARSRLKTLLGLNDNPYFVFFSNGNDYLRNSVEALEGCAQWLDTVSRRLGNKIEFLVRLHPNEDGRLYESYPQLKVFKNECDLDTVLGAADICAALCSTTLSDALLYDKPVLQFYADGWPDLADNWRRGIAERISNSEQLVSFLEGGPPSWTQMTERQGIHKHKVFANHQHAIDTVGRFIMQEISS